MILRERERERERESERERDRERERERERDHEELLRLNSKVCFGRGYFSCEKREKQSCLKSEVGERF